MSIRMARWDITSKCNLNCKHCQVAKFNAVKWHCDLSFNEVTKVIERLASAGVKRVGLLGGEPLFRNDIIPILKYFRTKKILVTLNTNGLLINKFSNLEWTGFVDEFLISLDGTTEEEHEFIRGKDTFNNTIKNIKLLKKFSKSCRVGISYVLNKNNIGNVNKIFNIAEETQADSVIIDLVHKTGNAYDCWNKLSLGKEEIIESTRKILEGWNFNTSVMLDLKYLTNRLRDSIEGIEKYDLPNKYVCEAPGITSIFISNEGNVYPSQFFAYNESLREYSTKSLVNNSLNEIVNSEYFVKFTNLYDKELYRTFYTPCSKCEYSGKQCNPSPISFWFGKSTPVEICNY